MDQVFGESLYLAEFFEQAPIDGILGLAFKDIAVDKVTPVFDNMIEQVSYQHNPEEIERHMFNQRLIHFSLQKLLEKNQFSVYLSNTQYDNTSVMLFGGTDPQYYTGNAAFS